MTEEQSREERNRERGISSEEKSSRPKTLSTSFSSLAFLSFSLPLFSSALSLKRYTKSGAGGRQKVRPRREENFSLRLFLPANFLFFHTFLGKNF